MANDIQSSTLLEFIRALTLIFESNGFAGLVAAAATLTAGYLTIIWQDKRGAKRIRASMKTMIGAEIEAILDLIDVNDYLNQINRIREEVRNGAITAAKIATERAYFKVYEANLCNLGCLGKETAYVVKFYAFCNSALEDSDIAVSFCETPERFDNLNHPDAVSLAHRQLLQLHDSMIYKLEEAQKSGALALQAMGIKRNPKPGFRQAVGH